MPRSWFTLWLVSDYFLILIFYFILLFEDYKVLCNINCTKKIIEMLAELSRREGDANIKPDPDIDVFMKVAKD